jgi:hypothetical protein
MAPIIGTKLIKSHHPLLPVSCSLRTPTAKDGKKTAREYRPVNGNTEFRPRMDCNIESAIETMKLKSMNIQYSLRLALP